MQKVLLLGLLSVIGFSVQAMDSVPEDMKKALCGKHEITVDDLDQWCKAFGSIDKFLAYSEEIEITDPSDPSATVMIKKNIVGTCVDSGYKNCLLHIAIKWGHGDVRNIFYGSEHFKYLVDRFHNNISSIDDILDYFKNGNTGVVDIKNDDFKILVEADSGRTDPYLLLSNCIEYSTDVSNPTSSNWLTILKTYMDVAPCDIDTVKNPRTGKMFGEELEARATEPLVANVIKVCNPQRSKPPADPKPDSDAGQNTEPDSDAGQNTDSSIVFPRNVALVGLVAFVVYIAHTKLYSQKQPQKNAKIPVK